MRNSDIMRQRQELGRRLRGLREAQGLSQRRLAQMTGMDHKYIYEIEHSKSSPTVDTLTRLAAALGIEPRDLL